MTELMNISTIILIGGLALITIGIAAWSLQMIFRTMEFFMTKQAANAKK